MLPGRWVGVTYPECYVFGVECSSVFGAHDTSLGLGLVAGIGVALIECVCVEVFMLMWVSF